MKQFVFGLAVLLSFFPAFLFAETFPEYEKTHPELRTFLRENLFHRYAGIDLTPSVVLTPRKTFVDDVSDLLLMIREESPVLFEKIDSADRGALLEALLSAADSGICRMPEKHDRKNLDRPPKTPEPEICPPVTIAENQLIFLRIGTMDRIVSPDSIVRRDLLAISRLTRKPLGVLIDLRRASGNDYRDAIALLSHFTSIQGFPYPDSALSAPLFDLPAAILVSGDTCGSAEIFASLIEQRKQGITIGERTAGRPVSTRKGSAAGSLWLIPEIPLKEIEPHAHQPVIEMPAFPCVSMADLRKTGEFEEDHAMTRAVDLLLSLDALKRHHWLVPRIVVPRKVPMAEKPSAPGASGREN